MEVAKTFLWKEKKSYNNQERIIEVTPDVRLQRIWKTSKQIQK